jgi:ribosome-binding protein aMBF1 (putative translation factor)
MREAPLRTLDKLEAFVEREAKKEGTAAEADLEAQRLRFRLARELTLARKARHLTQSELAIRAGVPQSVISKIEGGSANATQSTLARVLQPLGYTLAIVPARARGSAKVAQCRAAK